MKNKKKNKKKKGHDIVKTEVTKGEVTLALENGIRLHIVSNKGYIHVHFSGIGDSQIVACPFSHLDEDPKQELIVSNNINLFYQDPEEIVP